MPGYLINAAIKGVIEGVTEFLPISSTGHLVLVRHLFPLAAPDDGSRLENLFDIVVQFPAILAVLVLYRQRLYTSARGLFSETRSRNFWLGIGLAFIPLASLGMVFKKKIEEALMHPRPVAIALIVGGIILILIERRSAAVPAASASPTTAPIERAEDTPLATAIIIGFFQALALMPGTSRSAATIIGGRAMGLSRGAAAEFSFFLAIPTMAAAFGYKFIKEFSTIQPGDWPILVVGGITSFFSAWLVVRWFIRFLQNNSMASFGVYRIILGVLVLIFAV
ncbi:MAG TPA: undecaprenyl-diphosphate phosphatase [Planctomycetota bacterium]|nr:undecaprenyl-diphosphate phosphatase [Planctomycetota bacterium]